MVRTYSNFGYAKVHFEVTNKLIQEYFKEHKAIQIITGFIGTASDGETTTIGRSGSDYTAAIFAGALDASDLEIWTDVDGMMTANYHAWWKRSVTLPQMSYEEAMELSHFGAKNFSRLPCNRPWPVTTPIWIKNTFNPTFKGTLISTESVNGKLIKGISSVNNISLLRIQGSGLLGVARRIDALCSAHWAARR